MSYTEPIEKSNGTIRETKFEGAGGKTVVTGGAKVMPFYSFDGETGHTPVIAMEVFDEVPDTWPAAVVEPFADVISDPAAWAKRCVEQFGADMICIQLAGTEPSGTNKSPAEAAAVVRAVADAVDVPLVVFGCGNAAKDADVLKAVAEACSDRKLLLGAATEDNYRPIVAAALAYGHSVIGNSPIDVNMAKQLNILMTQMDLDPSRIAMDPSTGAVGYGIEYSYTVIERLRLAALRQNDSMTQFPIICNLGKEAWRTKEAKASADEEPAWGDPAERGVMWEALTATTHAMAGADILVMRHPEAVKSVREALGGLSA